MVVWEGVCRCSINTVSCVSISIRTESGVSGAVRDKTREIFSRSCFSGNRYLSFIASSPLRGCLLAGACFGCLLEGVSYISSVHMRYQTDCQSSA